MGSFILIIETNSFTRVYLQLYGHLRQAMSETEPGLSNLHTCHPVCRFSPLRVLKPWPGLAAKPLSTPDLQPWGSSSPGSGALLRQKGKVLT